MVARGELQWRPLECALRHVCYGKSHIMPIAPQGRDLHLFFFWAQRAGGGVGGTNICTFFFQDSKFGCESLRVGASMAWWYWLTELLPECSLNGGV